MHMLKHVCVCGGGVLQIISTGITKQPDTQSWYCERGNRSSDLYLTCAFNRSSDLVKADQRAYPLTARQQIKVMLWREATLRRTNMTPVVSI